MLAEAPSNEATLNDAIVATRRAVTTYVRTCLSQHDIGNLATEDLLRALSPIAELRTELAARPKKDDTKKPVDAKPVDPPAPKPPAPPPPLPPIDDDE